MQGLAALDLFDMIMFTFAAGGKEMMKAAMEGILPPCRNSAGSERPKLNSRTQLTSTTQEAMRTGTVD